MPPVHSTKSVISQLPFQPLLARLGDVLALDARAVDVRLVDAEVVKSLLMISVMNPLVLLAIVNITKMKSGFIFSGSHETAPVTWKSLLAAAGVERSCRRPVCHSRERIGHAGRGSGRRSRDGERLRRVGPVNAAAAHMAAASADAVPAAAAVDGMSLVSDGDGADVGWGDVDRAGVDRSGVDRSGVGERSVGRDGVHVHRRGAGRGSGHSSNLSVAGEVVARSSIRIAGRMKVAMSAQGGVVGRGGGKYSRLACVVVAGDVTGNARAHDRVGKGCGD